MNTPRLLPGATRLNNNDSIGQIAIVDGFFNPDECQRAVELYVSATHHPSPIGDNRLNVGEKVRKSDVTFLPPDSEHAWLFEKLEYAVMQLNRSYGLDLSGFHESLQLARYQPGGHYDWHVDLGTGGASNRKLSISVQLSDPAEYEGGDLEFFPSDSPTPRTLGTLIAFPSFMVHRVSPVTRGTRHSLVSWISGPVYR
ncbi:MAG: 2OG-Fe(II) oxygenase [Pseudomonadota bacterium]|nr:2OG-Fe(II) oxygenase [Pseudomonadota bacterium]